MLAPLPAAAPWRRQLRGHKRRSSSATAAPNSQQGEEENEAAVASSQHRVVFACWFHRADPARFRGPECQRYWPTYKQLVLQTTQTTS
ncbi:hypothetical protein Purlil1_11430 [Purpureocillium lilacinum]|uniref:Uncharacterized protein n=1 Tax=Purpureocillium lilacinum TaxID=33203 RepID=A0ABR0BJJ3_PURLI|nr:hypothetical protein Purlil1_11430 [Purpureocillium lilacinum]